MPRLDLKIILGHIKFLDQKKKNNKILDQRKPLSGFKVYRGKKKT